MEVKQEIAAVQAELVRTESLISEALSFYSLDGTLTSTSLTSSPRTSMAQVPSEIVHCNCIA